MFDAITRFIQSLFGKRQPVQVSATYTLGGDIVALLLMPLGLQTCFLWDSEFCTVSLEDWKQIITDIRASNPAYTRDRFDCENFAMRMTTVAVERYGINSCMVAVGDSPGGYHGFNVFFAVEDDIVKLFILEPQSGQIWPIDGDSGYKPQIIIAC